MVDAVLIGSRAAKHWFPRFPRTNDYDIVIKRSIFDNWANKQSNAIIRKCTSNGHKVIVNVNDDKFEFEFETLESNRLILEREYSNHIDISGLKCGVATPEMLLAIKRSHLYHSDCWHKTVKDYHFLRSQVVLNDELKLSEIRRAEKNKRTGRSLMVDNDNFFNGSQRIVNRIYVHDDLHYATCYYDEPIWVRCKKDLSKAYIDKDLFDQLSQLDKVRMVQEEGFVIALERQIIPKNIDEKNAYKWAIMRIGTTLTSGWFRDFTIDNYHEVMKYNHDFIGLFKSAVANGKIRKII